MTERPGTVFRRPRAPLSPESLLTGYGRPLRCPKCCAPDTSYYGKLKLPGEKETPCVNCGTRLVSVPGRSRGSRHD